MLVWDVSQRWRLRCASAAVAEEEPTIPLSSSMAATMNKSVEVTQQVVARDRWVLSNANTKMPTLTSSITTPNNRIFIVNPYAIELRQIIAKHIRYQLE